MNILNPYKNSAKSWLKGALHLHSTNSDGSDPPKMVIEDYEKLGFDFIAFTDHNTVQPKEVFDVETSMVVINGCEYRGAKWKGELGVVGCENQLGYERLTVQEYINQAVKPNTFVTYNHPDWGMNHWSAYEMFMYDGTNALEIFNGVGDELGGTAVSTIAWDQVLTAGKKMWGIATDDAHHPCQRNNGWVMVNAAKDKESIISALRDGNFYSSTGVIIDSIILDNNVLKVKAKDAHTIQFITKSGIISKEITSCEAEYKIKEDDVYVRVELYGNNLKKAYTNPIFIETEKSKSVQNAFRKRFIKVVEKAGKSEHLLMFDFDGVIADSLDIFYEKFVYACNQHGYHLFNDCESFLQLFDGNLFEGMRNSGIKEKDILPVLNSMSKSLNPEIDIISLFPGIIEMLNFLSDLHPVYIITSNVSPVVESILEKNGIKGIYEVIGSDKEQSKTKKIRNIIEKYPMHIPFYIGDTKGDMIEARLANARTVGVGWGWHDENKLSEAWPDYIAKDIPELQDILT